MNQEKELSKEEIEARKKEMLDFYEDQIKFLKVQEEFERLSSSIEECRLKKLIAVLKYSEIVTQMESNNKDNKEESSRKNSPLTKV